MTVHPPFFSPRMLGDPVCSNMGKREINEVPQENNMSVIGEGESVLYPIANRGWVTGREVTCIAGLVEPSGYGFKMLHTWEWCTLWKEVSSV